MDVTIAKALAAAARAFADEIESGLPSRTVETRPLTGAPTAGSAESMVEVLRSVGRINHDEGRGATEQEMREIAESAGMDPRGMAGYYTSASRLLEIRDNGRWITEVGEQRLAALRELLKLQVPG